MSLMQAQITDRKHWIRVDTKRDESVFLEMDVCFHILFPMGVHFDRSAQLIQPGLTPELILPFTEEVLVSSIETIEVVEGYGVRASALGYLDCTAWEFFSSRKEADARHRALGRELRGDD